MCKSAESILSAYSFIKSTSLEKILSFGYKSKNGRPIPSFDENSLINLCSEARQVFMDEKNVLEIKGNVVVVGDIHGNLHDLIRVIKYAHERRLKLLFLGNYVDHGSFSLECLTLLLAKKIVNPESFYLIRGNHEFNSVCSEEGFKNEIVTHHDTQLTNETKDHNQEIHDESQKSSSRESNYYNYTEKLYNAFMKVFCYLPIAAIVNETTFCVHGGLSPKLRHADSLNTLIKRPIHYFEDNLILSDLVWGDPTNSTRGMFLKNPKGRGYQFNKEALSVFLKDNSFTRMIRSHQCIPSGSLRSFDDRCITVFSASLYDRFETINSSVVELFQRNDNFRISTFFPMRRLLRKDAIFYKVQPLNISEKKIPLSISLIKPQAVPSFHVKGKTSREFDQINSQKSASCTSSRLLFSNPLKNKFNRNLNQTLQSKKAMIHNSFSTSYIEEDDGDY